MYYIETSSLLPHLRQPPDSAAGGPQYKPPGSGDHWGRGNGSRTLDQAPDPQNAPVLRPGKNILARLHCFMRYTYNRLGTMKRSSSLNNVDTEYCIGYGVIQDMYVDSKA